MYKVRRFLKGVAKELDPREPFIKHTGERNINNLWTGYEFGGKAKLMAPFALIGYAQYNAMNTPLYALGEQAKAQDVESLPGTRGDMQGYQAFPQYPDLGTSGDLVFALHKLRHGG